MIIKRLEVGMFASNCYILGDEATKEGLLIDPGDEAKRILSTVQAEGLNIKYILLTHGHIDHIAAVARIKEATKAHVAMHPYDAGALRGESHSMFGRVEPAPPDILLKEGDLIKLSDISLKVLHTPGHTPGGICFLGKNEVFTGDTLFYQSVGRSDLGGGNHNQLINSIKAKLLTLPDETIVYPGHGPETNIGDERKSNLFLR